MEKGKTADFENVSPGYDDEMEDIEIEDADTIELGYCNHCGDGVLVEPSVDQAEADMLATASCKCKDGKKARKASADAAEDDPPEVKIANAHKYIDACFADVDEQNRVLLKTMAALLVEGSGKRYNAVIDDSVIATLFKRANGRVSIERKNWTSERAEI